MDKNPIQKYAIWARTELIKRVSQKADQYEVSAEADSGAISARGVVLSDTQKKQRAGLIWEVKKKGYEQVIEEVAYTWFNRFIALRFMEVNGYLPSHIRVFTDEENHFKPQILTEAIHLDLDGLDMEKVYAYKDANQEEELYKYLLITQCNALSTMMPGVFQRITDDTELLFPDHLLREGSVIERMVAEIPEDDWKDEVQIIGWLYQYYNTEPKQAVFDGLKKNIKITKDKIPAATQLFTPDWIVRYMVENSLGRLWLENHPNDTLKANWKYYLDEAEQTPEVAERLRVLRAQSPVKSPEDIKLIDPCMGSGHILVYAFDVLMQIYESEGYNSRDASKLILGKNLYGLEIDKRAYQLAYFALMMTARKYNRRIFSENVKPQVYFPDGDIDGAEYGSLIHVDREPKMVIGKNVDFRRLLAQKYDVVVTNPPYMGSPSMNGKLSDFVKKNYSDSKGDLFACLIEKCGELLKPAGYQAMITQHAWMFLSSYEKLRGKLLSQHDIVNMAHLGARAFEEIGGEVVQTAAFVLSARKTTGYLGTYVRLVDFPSQNGKEAAFLSGKHRYTASADNFAKIPGNPVAYWVSEKALSAFVFPTMNDIAEPRHGLATSNNDLFLKLWFEIDIGRTSLYDLKRPENYKWIPMNKGGSFRKWFGNNEWVINYEHDGQEIKKYASDIYVSATRTIQNTKYYFQKSLTWSALTSGTFSVRSSDIGYIFGSGGYCAFVVPTIEKYILALMNNVVTRLFISAVSPTLNYEVGHIKTIPVIRDEEKKPKIDSLVTSNISLSRADWDSFETSWDFKRHPLIQFRVPAATWGNEKPKFTIQAAYIGVKAFFSANFQTLKANEEELNRIFINIYGLQDELKPEEEDKDVTVHRIYDSKDDIPESMAKSQYTLTKQDIIKSFISYAVGCMFGRYSLDAEGLAFAGGEWDESKYKTFFPDKDNVLPISDDEYFEDDIVGRFVNFVKVVYGADALEENLRFIADALGGKGAPRDVIRNYFLNDFYKDHCRTYKKRPIYWLFDSGKKNGFKCLIYMHRYQPDTIARIRTDYVHEQQARYRTAIAGLERQMTNATTSERVRLTKQLTKLKEQAEETRVYEEKIHHLADQMISIDLDDGVKHNYAIFQDVLAKIK